MIVRCGHYEEDEEKINENLTWRTSLYGIDLLREDQRSDPHTAWIRSVSGNLIQKLDWDIQQLVHIGYLSYPGWLYDKKNVKSVDSHDLV